MARAQTGGLITGGGLDPYVAAASQQRSAQGSRMREAAMSEQGATKRQAMSNEAGVAQSAIQAASARAMQDAQMADAERGRREDAEYRKQEMELADTLGRERMKLENEINRANQAEDYKMVEKLTKRLDAQDALDKIMMENSNRNYMNLVRNLAKSQGAKASATEKARSLELNNIEKAKMQSKIVSTQMESAIDNLSANRKLDWLGEDVFSVTEKMKGAVTSLSSPLAALIPGVTMKGLKEDKAQSLQKAHDSRIEEALNGALSHIGVTNTSIGELREEGLKTLETSIQEGKIDATDIPRISAALDAAQQVMNKKAEFAEDDSYRLYKRWSSDLRMMKSKLHSLSWSSQKLAGDNVKTVGMVVKQGLNWIPGAALDEDGYEQKLTEINQKYNDELSGMIPNENFSLVPSMQDEWVQPYLKMYPELGGILSQLQGRVPSGSVGWEQADEAMNSNKLFSGGGL